MKAQEIISIFTHVTIEDLGEKGNVVKMYPELDQFFNRGMYVENITQTCLDNGKYMITFLFRYYNTSQSKIG